MKKIATSICLVLFVTLSVNAQTLEDKQQISMQPAKVIRIANINGSIDIKPNAENKITIDAKRTLKAKDPEEFQAVKDKVNLASKRVGDTLVVFIDGLPQCSCEGEGMNKTYNYLWDNVDYEFLFDMKVNLPAETELVVSTINEGDIKIDGITGNMKVKNINGNISIENIQSKVKLSTINGDVDLSFLENPKSYSRFYTLNGNINATFAEAISMDVIFDSFNGEFYTNVDDITQSVVTEVDEGKETKNGIKYKVGAKSQIRFRNGGNRVEFETFNGDVILKENTK